MASIYTSRQLLDPNWIYRSQEQSRQDYRDRLESLGETAKWFRDWRNHKAEEEKTIRDQNTRRALLGNYSEQGPTEAAAANRFIETGDPSGIMNLENMKAVNKARDEEKTARDLEERDLKKRRYELAIRDIESETDPSKRIPKIKAALELGIDAGVDVSPIEDMLEQEQEAKGKAEFIVKEKAFDEAKEKKRTEIKQRTKELIEEYVSRLEDISDKDEYNQVLGELKTMAEANGLRSEIKWPEERKKSRTVRTAKEEDEYKELSDLKSDYDKGLRDQWTTVQQSRLDELSKMKPFGGK